MIVQLFVVVRVDIATGKHLFDVREKLRIDGHHVFKMPVGGTIFNHPNLAIAFNDLSLYLTNLFINQNAYVFLAAEDLFSRLNYTIRTK